MIIIHYVFAGLLCDGEEKETERSFSLGAIEKEAKTKSDSTEAEWKSKEQGARVVAGLGEKGKIYIFAVHAVSNRHHEYREINSHSNRTETFCGSSTKTRRNSTKARRKIYFLSIFVLLNSWNTQCFTDLIVVITTMHAHCLASY